MKFLMLTIHDILAGLHHWVSLLVGVHKEIGCAGFQGIRMCALLIMFAASSALFGFNLDSAHRYAQTRIELPPLVEGYAAFNPDYSPWYASQESYGITAIVERLGIYKPSWSVNQFAQLMRSVTDYRRLEGFSQDQNLMMRVGVGSEFLLVGPLFGSYHSLVRILLEWRRKGYLSSDLKLTRSNVSIVFLGNVIDGSPYIMETLSLILALMQANSRNVLYLQGEHEADGYWLGYGLQKEIESRAHDHSLYKTALSFFKTLSPSLFLRTLSEQADMLLLTARASVNTFLEEACQRKLASAAPGSLLTCSRSHRQKEAQVKALITGEDRLVSYRMHKGLVLAPAQDGAITWALFSAPNRIYQQDFQFYFDAFSILTIGQSMSTSVLTLYNQDVREQTGFKEAGCYAALSGKSLIASSKGSKSKENKGSSLLSAADQSKIAQCNKQKPLERVVKSGTDDNPIFIGCTLDLTKGASAIGKPLKEGISLCTNWVNLHGGINGRPVQVVFMDDQYNPEKARDNVEKFIKTYKSTLFLCNLGSPTLEAYIDLVRDNKIFVFFPATGAPIFRKPELKGVVHWRGSYRNEAQVLTNFMLKEYHTQKIGFLYQNDVFGMGALEGAQEALKNAGIKDSTAVSYERNTTGFKPQIEKLKVAGVTAVGFFSTSIAAIEFIRQAGVDFFLGRRAFGISDLGEESFKQFAAQIGLEVVTSSFVPNPRTSELEIVKQFRNALYKQGYLQENIFELEGFIGARIAMNILRQAGPDVSHAAITKVLEGMKQYPFLGFTFTFNPQKREIANLLWIDTGDPEWITQKAEG